MEIFNFKHRDRIIEKLGKDLENMTRDKIYYESNYRKECDARKLDKAEFEFTLKSKDEMSQLLIKEELAKNNNVMNELRINNKVLEEKVKILEKDQSSLYVTSKDLKEIISKLIDKLNEHKQ